MTHADSPQAAALTRSPELMSRQDTGLLIVDVQGKLITMIPQYRRIIWNLQRLLSAAEILGMPRTAAEQYPKGLGPTVPELAERLPPIPDKVTFSCGGCAAVWSAFDRQKIRRLVVGGIETHVCVQQTVFDLLAAGFRVYLPIDATGSRYDIDYQTALRRMDSAGAVLTTTESAIFEWCESSAAPEFKQISRLIQEQPPAE
jgi:nicotinamidase-related amidase